MYVPSRVNLNNLPFSFNTSEIYYTNDCSHFQIGTVSESHYLKSSKFYAWPSLSILLGSHRSSSPILTYKVISIAVSLFHMFYLDFAASKNRAFINRANFEDIIKFGRLYFAERKCQLFNINANRWIKKYQPLNTNVNLE